MVVDVKEKLDIWRYSRTCFKVLISIIFFIYNLLSILYHATILCCVLIFTPQMAIIFRYSRYSAKARQLCLSLSKTYRHFISAGFPPLFFFTRVAECHYWSSMFDKGLVFGQRFDSRPGLPCCNCLRVFTRTSYRGFAGL